MTRHPVPTGTAYDGYSGSPGRRHTVYTNYDDSQHHYYNKRQSRRSSTNNGGLIKLRFTAARQTARL